MSNYFDVVVGLHRITSKQWMDIQLQLESLNLPYAHNDSVLTHIVYKGKQYQVYTTWIYMAIIRRVVKPSEITPQGYKGKAVLEACETPEVKALMLQNALGIKKCV